MHLHRKGSMYKKIVRKMFALVVLLIGIRLLWLSVVYGLSSNVAMKEQKNAQTIKHKVKFNKYTERNVEISRTFTFSEVKGVRLKESVNSVIHTSNHSDKRGSRHNIGTIAPVQKDKHELYSTNNNNTNGINLSDRKYHSKAHNYVNTNTNYKTLIEDTIVMPHTGTVDKTQTENVAVQSEATKTGDKVYMKHINEPIERQTVTHSKIPPKRLSLTINKSTQHYIKKPTDKANTRSSTDTKTATYQNVKSEFPLQAVDYYNFNSSIIEKLNNKSTNERVSLILAKNNGFDRILEEAATKGMCALVENWTHKLNHADLSTYDLFDNVNYTMFDNGQYPLPVKSIADINKEKTVSALTVILVPFSHADPGYGLTIEEYYNQMTHATLDNMITKLTQYPNMTFQWAETVFLSRWFQDLDSVGKEKVRKLIQNGQLEIVLGGWVMPDEASTHYVAVVDQLIEGHQWLVENLGVIPKSAWVNDPFGYSSTMPYFWKASGMDNLLFLRINQPVKAKLMKIKSLEFMWRPYWKTTNQSDVLSSLMSYTNYWVSDVCGPEQIHCQEFNFLHLGEGNSKAIAVTDANVAEQAKKLSVQFRITGDLYKYNTLYIGLGEDFSYPKLHQWDNMYNNYEKLINYINSQKNWNMTVKFGTLSEYFKRVRTAESSNPKNTESSRDSALTFPTLSGDFFPYTERNQEFWTGYFTTRPLNKRFSREIESLIRAADIFNVMVYSLFKYYRVQYTAYADVAGSLRMARQELGMFMHHDGITGTSLPHVVRDFEKRLLKANERAHEAFKMTIVTMLSKGKHNNPKLLQEETVKTGSKKMAGHLVIDTNKEAKVLLINTVAKRRKEVINIFVASKHIKISSPSNWNVPYQVTVVRLGDEHIPYVVSFEADMPAFGIEEYTLSHKAHAHDRVESREDKPSKSESVITIENVNMKVEFDKNTGIMKRIIHRNERETNIAAQFMVYQSKTSGAYIFGPAGPAKAFSTGKASIKVTQGPLVSEVKVTSLGLLLSVKLYNTSGIQGQGVYVKTEIDMAAMGITEMEVILRFQTDVKNDRNFYTDQNGYQLIGRKTRHENKIESNYYPVTTMGILEDNNKRFTLHCRQPHGGASLNQGQFEVMLDRHTFRDDKRGLGQGVYDNVKVNSDFILHIEHKTHHFRPEEVRYTYPSQDSVLLNELLQNEIVKYHVVDASLKLLKKVHPLKTAELPCGVSIVGLRNLVKNNLKYNSTSLVLHRKALHCGYTPLNGQCSGTKKVTIKSLFPKAKVKISETSLSHLYEKQILSLYSDLTPDIMELRSFKIQI